METSLGFIGRLVHPILGNKMPKMPATDNGALEDIPGRLADLDQEGIDLQMLYPTTLLAVPFINDKDYAAVLCRAYHNYVADQIKGSPRLKAVASLPSRDPSSAVEEMRGDHRAGVCGRHDDPCGGGRRGLQGLGPPRFLPSVRGSRQAQHPHFGALCGRRLRPAMAEYLRQVFYTHSVAHPFSQMIGLMTIIGGGIMERLPGLRVDILETGCTWLPYWMQWLDAHYDYPRCLKGPDCSEKTLCRT